MLKFTHFKTGRPKKINDLQPGEIVLNSLYDTWQALNEDVKNFQPSEREEYGQFLKSTQIKGLTNIIAILMFNKLNDYQMNLSEMLELMNAGYSLDNPDDSFSKLDFNSPLVKRESLLDFRVFKFVSNMLGMNEKLSNVLKETIAQGGDAAMVSLSRNNHAMGMETQQGQGDNAMKGGIDLTPANMNLQTQNAGEGIKFHIDPLMLKQLENAPGFVPVIISIQPMQNIRLWLGLNSVVNDNFQKADNDNQPMAILKTG